MISRHWTGIARRDRAEAYVAHLQTETFPTLRTLAGFRKASILRRAVESGVEFLIVTDWESLDAIRAFAGDDVESAVVPAAAQAMMVSFDRAVRHYDVLA